MAGRVRNKLISDENLAVNRGKMIQTKAPTETKRAALSDLAGNKMHTGVVPANPSVYKSKLPILKSAPTRTKSSLETKPRIAASKENQVPSSALNNAKPTVNSLVDKTRSLKIGAVKKTVKQVDATVSEKNDVSLKLGYGVEDIDKRDRNNIFLVAEYAKDIHTYLKVLERSHPIQEDYLKERPITPKMRSILIDWLVEVQQEYKLLQETLHIAVGILDTYLQNVPEVSRNHMQLIGVTALFLAAKYEEIMIPSVDEFVYISASAFREADLYEMERQMFRTVNFDLSRPISLNFLRRYSKAAHAEALQHSFAKYFIELALIEYTLCHVNPSLVAAAALCLALFLTDSKNMRVLDGSLWTPTLEFYSGYKFADLRPTIKILAKLAFNAKTSPYTAVYQKYSKPKYLKVSENNALYSSRMKDLLVSAN